MDILKIGILSLFILISAFFYFRFVSLASTEGYFLRQVTNELDSKAFEYEIVKIEILDQKRSNREKMYGNSQNKKVIDVYPEIVSIPVKTELTINR